MPRDRAGWLEPGTAQLPAKHGGVHRPVVLVAFTVSNGQAAAASRGARVKLAPQAQLGKTLVCIDCRRPWDDVRGQRCEAAAADANTSGLDVMGPLGLWTP